MQIWAKKIAQKTRNSRQSTIRAKQRKFNGKKISCLLLKGLIYLARYNFHTDGLGKPSPSKTDEFSEKFQTAFAPPPPLIFGKLYCNFF